MKTFVSEFAACCLVVGAVALGVFACDSDDDDDDASGACMPTPEEQVCIEQCHEAYLEQSVPACGVNQSGGVDGEPSPCYIEDGEFIAYQPENQDWCDCVEPYELEYLQCRDDCQETPCTGDDTESTAV